MLFPIQITSMISDQNYMTSGSTATLLYPFLKSILVVLFYVSFSLAEKKMRFRAKNSMRANQIAGITSDFKMDLIKVTIGLGNKFIIDLHVLFTMSTEA